MLRPLCEDVAREMADALSQVDPWARYGIASESLVRYFREIEVGAPRFGLYVGDDVAGVVGVRLNWLRGPYLQFLGVVPKFQGHGVGGLVLTWLERVVATKSDANIWIFVSQTNTGGRAFYEKNGYRRAATIDDLVVEGEGEVLMRKRL